MLEELKNQRESAIFRECTIIIYKANEDLLDDLRIQRAQKLFFIGQIIYEIQPIITLHR